MAQTWVPNFRKRLMLAALDSFARFTPQRSGTSLAVSKGEIKRILVIELWNIGDVVLAMPFLGQLRALFPAARISLLARPHARVVLDGTGLVDEFIETDLGWTERSIRFNPLGYRWGELRRVRGELRRRDFDLAFKSRMHIREHVLLALSGARRRVAFGFGIGDRVLTDPIQIGDPHRHKADDWLKLLEPFGGAVSTTTPRLHVSESEQRWATDYLRSQGVSASARLVGIHPGASIAAKRWPLERFAMVAGSLSKRPGVKVLVFIEPGRYGDTIAQIGGVIPAKVGLRELIALIARCELLVCNDSGPMHIAGGLRVPTVAVFGTGIARWFSPLGDGHRLVVRQQGGAEPSSADEAVVDPFDVSSVPVSRVMDAVDAALAT